MKPLQKNLLLGLVLGLLLLGLVATATAFSTLSLSRVDFSSNDAMLNKPAWLLTVVEDGNQAYAVGTIDNTQITRSDGATATNDLKIEITNTANNCVYNFQNSYTPIYVVQQKDVSWYNYLSECQGLGGTWSGRAGFYGYCLILTTTAQYTPLSTPVTTVQSNLAATVNGQTVSGTVNNIGQKSTWLGDKIYASWSGNLVSGQSCPSPSDSLVGGIKQGTTFQIVNKAPYDAYRVDQSDLIACVNGVNGLSGYDATKQGIADCVTAYNAKSNAILLKTNRAPFNTATVANGQASITMPALLQYPVITMRVDASWLGIYLPVGKPQIISVSDVTFSEGSTGIVTATVKNAGTARAGFNLGVTCNGAANAAGTSQTLSLDPGAQTSVTLPLSGTAGTSQAKTTCTLTMADINNPSNVASKTFSVTINPIAICQSGQERCTDGKTVEICNGAGTAWTTNQVCPNGCKAAGAVYTCSEPVACTKDSDCANNDPTLEAHCVGVLTKQCEYTPKPVTDFAPWIKLGLFALAAIVFALLGYYVSPWFYIGTGIASIGAIIGIFSMVSTLAAIAIVLGLALIIAGISLAEVAPSIALPFIGGGIILILAAFLLFFYPPSTWFGGLFP